MAYVGLTVEGTLTVAGHCTFAWRENVCNGMRYFRREPQHCETCIATIRRLGFKFDACDGNLDAADAE